MDSSKDRRGIFGILKRIERLLWKLVVKVANSIKTILIIYVASLFAGGAAFSLLEGTSFGDGLWWADVTALTVGYGDLAPATTAGRIVATIFQHFWVYGMIPLIAVNLLTHVIQDDNEFTHDEQEWQEEALKAIAAKVGVELPPSPSDTNFKA